MTKTYGIETAVFNTWGILERLKHVTGIEWKRVSGNDHVTVYRPKDKRIPITITRRMKWNLLTAEGRIQCLALKPLYPDIRRAVAAALQKAGA